MVVTRGGESGKYCQHMAGEMKGKTGCQVMGGSVGVLGGGTHDVSSKHFHFSRPFLIYFFNIFYYEKTSSGPLIFQKYGNIT